MISERKSKVFQAGGDGSTLPFRNPKGGWTAADWVPVYDAFRWESFFDKNNLYVRSTWNQRWDGTDLWKAIREDRVFLCFLHPLDLQSLLVESGPKVCPAGSRDVSAALQKDDVKVARLPAGVSLELNRMGGGHGGPCGRRGRKGDSLIAGHQKNQC